MRLLRPVGAFIGTGAWSRSPWRLYDAVADSTAILRGVRMKEGEETHLNPVSAAAGLWEGLKRGGMHLSGGVISRQGCG